ncbi:MAG: hypothetical protein DRO04_02520, partial [Candidatus Iainarchaeum archaeon]
FFEKDNEQLTELITTMHKYCCYKLNIRKIELIKKAFYFAYEAHKSQRRASGEPYFIHPLAVAKKLAEYGFDEEVVAAGLLHDVIEDADVSKETLEKLFGKKIADLVDGVTKLTRIGHKSHVKNLQKILLATVGDPRVIIIKLVDKLHNLSTLEYLDERSRKKYAKMCLEVYVPIAHRLGMHKLKDEMEDLAFKFAYPEEYEKLREKVFNRAEALKGVLNEVSETLTNAFQKKRLNAEIIIQPKTLFSIHAKMNKLHKTLDEIFDFLVLLVLVNNVDDCYKALGIIHQHFIPKPKKIKDFIAVPRNDLYQSLHTTVLTPEGNAVKIYIRTKEMEKIRNMGIIYLLHKSKKHPIEIQPIWIKNWLKSLGEFLSDYKGKSNFLKVLKADFLGETISVFVSGREKISIIKGATPLDVAYAVSEDIGNRCLEAKVNGKTVPLWHILESHDSVEFKLADKPVVKKEWLDFVAMVKTKSLIKKALKKIEREINEPKYANLRLKLVDKPGVLHRITKIMFDEQINIISVHSVLDGYPHICNLTIRYDNEKQLEHVIEKLDKMSEVLDLNYHIL